MWYDDDNDTSVEELMENFRKSVAKIKAGVGGDKDPPPTGTASNEEFEELPCRVEKIVTRIADDFGQDIFLIIYGDENGGIGEVAIRQFNDMLWLSPETAKKLGTLLSATFED